VVPPDSRYSSGAGSACSRFTYAPPVSPNAAYVPTTTRLDSSGATAGPPNFRWAWRIPYSTTATPYSSTWGANTISIRPAIPVISPWAQPGAPPSSAPASGRASSASAALTGTSSSTVHVSRADAIWLGRAPPASSSPPGPVPAGAARTGTTIAVRAPPAAML